MMEDEKEESPLRGMLNGPPNKRILSRQENKDYQEDKALSFLDSQNIPFSRVTVRRGPGRPPKVREPTDDNIAALIDESGVPLMKSNISILNNNKIAFKRERMRDALLDMLENPVPPS